MIDDILESSESTPKPSVMDDPSELFKTTCLGYDPSVKPCRKFLPGGFCALPMLFRCTEYLKQHEPTLSYSSIRLFSHCRRAFWYEWVMGLESKDKSLPLIMGTITSSVMAHLHGGNPVPVSEPTIQTLILSMAKSHIENSDRIVAWPYAMIGFFVGYVTRDFHTMRCRSEVKFTWKEPDYLDSQDILIGFLF